MTLSTPLDLKNLTVVQTLPRQSRTLLWKTSTALDLSEQHLLTSVREGQESAFEMIFKTYYQPLCRYAWAFLRNRESAEEVVQATFISIWERRSALEIQSSFKSYVYRMVRNSCLNVLKHEQVKMQHARDARAGGEPVQESAHTAVTGHELEDKIQDALQHLPEQCRLVFQLSRFEDLKYAEIADQLQISVKTVENQMGKALRIMREQLKDYLPVLCFFLSDLW